MYRMSLNAGTTIGTYEVTALIGQGGMGEVYQARDTKLDRNVALKVLPEAFTADPDRLARFEREAKVLASLNHPNIGTIYGLEEAEGVKALVLELVEGPTLADRIKQGPIPVEEALPIAKQIAEALEAAHEAGVIHRDLKPANIKVREDGTVKVLDFGLAKALEATSDGDPSQSPTLTAAATQMGVIMGTAAYMSPEQAKGKTVDRRSDVWAFGAVLYEMLAGRRAFVGDDVSDTLVSVFRDDPDWSRLSDDVPARVRQAIQVCLQKEPKQRVRDIVAVRLAMEGVFETTVSAPTEPAVVPTLQVWQRPLAALGIVVVAVLVSGLAVWTMMRAEPLQAPDLMRFAIVPPVNATLNDRGNRQDLAISPDGTQVVYVGRALGGERRLNLRPLDQLVGAPLRGGEGGVGPFVSPDGGWVGFVDGTRRTSLQKVSIFGGSPETLTESPSNILGASWGTDDQIIFGTNADGLFRVSAGSGEPEVLTTLDPEQGETTHQWPFIIPGREAVVFVISAGRGFDTGLTTGQLAVLDLNTDEVTRLGLAGVSPHYVSTGHLVYAVEDGSLRAVPFDAGSLEVTGTPVPLVEGVMVKRSGAANFSISNDGRLVYVSGAGGRTSRTVVWVDRNGRLEPLTGLPAADYRSVDVSPEGDALALELVDGQGSDVWIHDLVRGTRHRVTTDPAEDSTPLWTRGGPQVVFSSQRGRSRGLYRRNADGTGGAEMLITDDDALDLTAYSWGSNNTLVVGRRGNNQGDLALLSMEDEPALELLLESEFNENHAAVSPNGNWIAYASNRSGRYEIYVERFPDFGDRKTISTAGGQQPRWSIDGRELFYLGPQANRLMVVAVTTETGLRVGTPETLVEDQFFVFRGRSAYDVAPDGRFVMIRRGAETSENDATPQITVVLNWFEELKRLVPTN